MQLNGYESFAKRKEAEAVVVPCWQGKKHGELAVLEASLKKVIKTPTDLGDFKGKVGEISLVYATGKDEPRVIFIGLGKINESTPYTLQKAYGAVAAKSRALEVTSLNLVFPTSEEREVRACFDGLLLNNYVFEELKSKKTAVLLKKLGVPKKLLPYAKRWLKIHQAGDLTRDLVNGNADDVTPAFLAQVAKDLAKADSKMKVTVFDKKGAEKLGMGLLLAVNRGSEIDPALIVLEYNGAPKSKERTVIVGKGITYDTGGLNLKPTGFMEDMRTDMGGGGACLGAMKALSDLELKVNVTAIIASTENGIDARSFKPGDTYKSYSGKTVEIGNTDAEGRLVLADALAYAADKIKPTRMIDLATLTGGMVISLGEEVAGVMGTDDKLLDQLFECGEATGDAVWKMPMPPQYLKHHDSKLADIKNTGIRPGTALQAGLFLKEFVGKTPWVHMDIAGVAYTDRLVGCHSQRATGFGVRLLIELFERLES